MKHIYLYAFILVLTVIVGCSSGQDTAVTPSQDSSQDGGEGASASSGAQDQPPSQSYELSQEERNKALEFEQGKKTKLSTNYRIMEEGDVYVFGLGIKNVMPKEKNFKIDIYFKEAKTTGGLATPISEADKDTMLSWAGRNRFSNVEMEGNSETVIPVTMEVTPQIGPGEETIPGSYVFTIDVDYESSPRFWDDYSEEDLTIKVKE